MSKDNISDNMLYTSIDSCLHTVCKDAIHMRLVGTCVVCVAIALIEIDSCAMRVTARLASIASCLAS